MHTKQLRLSILFNIRSPPETLGKVRGVVFWHMRSYDLFILKCIGEKQDAKIHFPCAQLDHEVHSKAHHIGEKQSWRGETITCHEYSHH
jgi:hypothetical protein